MRPLLLLTFSFLLNHLTAQNILTTGLCKFSTDIQEIIKEQGYTLQNLDYQKIDSKTLADKDVLALFCLRQTWNGTPYLSPEQAKAIVNFVANGGALYITARKSYEPLLSLLGVQVSGVDGGTSGREWELIMPKITAFVPHPITENLTEIIGDISADFQLDKNWTVIGTNTNAKALLAIRNYGKGKIVLSSGERIFRNYEPSSNRYETDITQGSNKQFFINLFYYLKTNHQTLNTSTIPAPEKLFSIFPNPATQSITVLAEETMQQIEILNINGQVLKQVPAQEQTQIKIEINELPKGLYLLRIHTATNFQVLEFVVQ